MKLRSLFRLTAAGGALVFFPSLALAHPGHDGHELTWDFSGGFGHPLSGFDHLLAMIAVGLWAAQLGGRARWLVPSVFVGVMALGAAAGHYGATVSWLEQGIAASVVVLGLLVATTKRLPIAAGLALISGFAVLHGIAHGAEMPVNAGGLSYGCGFVLATALLHGMGLLIGQWAARRPHWIRQAAGAALIASGAMLFAL